MVCRYLFGKNIEEDKFKACFVADEAEYFGRQVSDRIKGSDISFYSI